ncbi:MAG: DUF4352 domain-containing protein [bacterium]|nr:DUF4352 domain-containing protein [bacterium]
MELIQMHRAFLLAILLLFAGCCSTSAPAEPPKLVDVQPEDFQGILEYQPPAEEPEPEEEEVPKCPEGFEGLEEYGCNFTPMGEQVSSKGMLINLTFLREKNCTFDFMDFTRFHGYFLVFLVDAENTGTEKEYLTPSHFTLFDSEGKKKTASEFNVLYCASKDKVITQTYLLQNQSSSGEIWFDVSERDITGQVYVAYDRNGVDGEELIFPFQMK